MVNGHWSKVTGVKAFQDVASAYATPFPIRVRSPVDHMLEQLECRWGKGEKVDKS